MKTSPLTTESMFRPAALLLALCCLALLAAGCSRKPPRDIEYESWKQLEKESPGHKPSEDERPVTFEEAVQESDILDAEEPLEIPLPTTPVVMNSPGIDVHTALRALARAANQSIIISQNVSGQTTAVFNGEPWGDAFRSILGSAGLIYTREGNIIKVLALDDLEQELRLIEVKQKRLAKENEIRRGSGLFTAVVKIKYADAEAMKTDMESFLTKDEGNNPIGSVKLDKHTNSLVIQGIRPDLKRIIGLVSRVDRPSPQIHLKAYIVETTSEMARSLGIQWGGSYTRWPVGGKSTDSLFINPGGAGTYDATTGSLTTTSTLGTGPTGQGIGINLPAQSVTDSGLGAIAGLAYGTLGGNLLDVQLSALEEDNKLKILSSPSLTTMDNQAAFTENGEKVPYVSINENGDQEVKFEDAVLRLEMTPHVIDDKHMKMEISVTKDEVDTSRTVEGNPFIIKKKTETTLIARNGETIVISGLTKNTKSGGNSGIPGFKDIPVLGWLFKNETKDDKLEEVLIFITPTMLAEWQPGKVQRSREDIKEEIRQEIEKEQE